MKRITVVAICAAILIAVPAVSEAQNRSESQMLLELRLVQEQLQKMQLAINQLSERVKTTESRLDTQASDTRKGFADQKVLVDAISSSMQSLAQRENEGSMRAAQLSQEMKSIRDGLNQQQKSLNEIINLLQPLASTAFAAAAAAAPPTDPAAPVGAGGAGSGGLKPNSLPPSPTAYYATAFGYYYAAQFDLAVTALTEAIKRYPDHPEAAKAQYTIGESYFQMGKHVQEALAAYTAVIANYKDPDVVPDAYFKQGQIHEQLGNCEAARNSYNQVIKLYKDSSPAAMATTALQKMKCK